MTPNTLYEYPFWGPHNSGPAERFADPSVAMQNSQVQAMLADSIRLRVPQETSENNFYLGEWQWNPIIIPSPQAPVQVPDQFTRAESLYSYAMMTLGGELSAQMDARLGNAGRKNV